MLKDKMMTTPIERVYLTTLSEQEIYEIAENFNPELRLFTTYTWDLYFIVGTVDSVTPEWFLPKLKGHFDQNYYESPGPGRHARVDGLFMFLDYERSWYSPLNTDPTESFLSAVRKSVKGLNTEDVGKLIVLEQIKE